MRKKNKSDKDLLKDALLSQLLQGPPRHSGELLNISLAMASISLMLLLIAYFLTSAPGS